ncbi:MAG: thioredoxin domain-containing protein [Luteolibacter sp.]
MKFFAVLPVISLLALPGCEKVRTLTDTLIRKAQAKKVEAATTLKSGQIRTLEAASYESFITQKNRLVLVDFYADWCGPCRLLGPVLEKAVAANPAVVVLGKVNVDTSRDLAIKQDVGSIPDVRIFKDGRQVGRIIGFSNEAKILETIAGLAKDVTPPAPKPAAPQVSPQDAGSRESSQSIQPMKKDWMPEGLQRR